MARKQTYIDCPICGKEFKSLGYARHRSACYSKHKKMKEASEKYSFEEIWNADEPKKPSVKSVK